MKWIKYIDEKPPLNKQILMSDGLDISVGIIYQAKIGETIVEKLGFFSLNYEGYNYDMSLSGFKYWMNLPEIPKDDDEGNL